MEELAKEATARLEGELAALRTVEFGLGWRVPKQLLTN
jgi:hypothetical protein